MGKNIHVDIHKERKISMGKENNQNGKTKNQIQQEEYQKMFDAKNEISSIYKRVYGVKPQLFNEFPKKEKEIVENMTVDLPEGLSEEEFMMVMMGAISADERMHNELSGSSNDGHFYRFNHVYMTDNMLVKLDDNREGKRMKGFEKVLVDARKNALDAVEAYKKGDKSLVQKYQQQFLDGAKQLAEIPEGSEKMLTKKGDYFFELAGKYIDQPGFREKNQDAASVNLRNYCHAHQVAKENVKRKQQMLEKVPPKGSKEREKQLIDVIASGYIVSRNRVRLEKEKDANIKLVQEEYGKMGHDKGSIFYSQHGAPFGYYMSDKSMINTVTGVDLILQEENGYEKIKEMYGESIKKTDLFQMLMNEDDEKLGNSLETVNLMIEMKKESFEDFKEVAIPQQLQEKAEVMSKPGKEETGEMLKEHIEGIQELSKEYKRHEKYRDQEVLQSGRKEDVRRSLNQIDDILANLEKADPSWRKMFSGKQDKFANVKESLKKLNEFSKNMDIEPGSPDYNQYIQLSKEVEKAAEEYLSDKKINHSDSNYEKKRIETVDAVHDALMYKRRSIAIWNDITFDTIASQEKKIINADIKTVVNNDERVAKAKENAQKYKEIYEKIAKTSTKSLKVKEIYYGGDYQNIKANSFSASRGAVVSIAVMKMAATGKYSLEDLADPSKFTEEKRKMGEEVVKHIEGGSHEDKKWIAGNIIEGQKKMMNMVDEFCNQHDILASDFGMTPEYATMKFTQDMIHDSYQELYHCLPEGDEYLKENYPNDPVQSAEQFRNDIQDRVRPIAEVMKAVYDIGQGVDQYLRTGKFDGNMVKAGMQLKVLKETLMEKQKQQPDKNLTKLLTADEIEKTLLKGTNAFSKAGVKLVTQLSTDPKTKDGVALLDAYIDQFADGSIYKDMKVDETGLKVENAPTASRLKADFRYEGFKNNKDAFYIMKDKIQDKISITEKKIENIKGAKDIYSNFLSTFTKMEMIILHSMSKQDVGKNYKDITKKYFKEKMALELCAKSPKAFENSKKEDILKGVENFKGYQELSKKIDSASIPEIMEFWDSDITQNIIDNTIHQQKEALEQKTMSKNMDQNIEKETLSKGEQIAQLV